MFQDDIGEASRNLWKITWTKKGILFSEFSIVNLFAVSYNILPYLPKKEVKLSIPVSLAFYV